MLVDGEAAMAMPWPPTSTLTLRQSARTVALLSHATSSTAMLCAFSCGDKACVCETPDCLGHMLSAAQRQIKLPDEHIAHGHPWGANLVGLSRGSALLRPWKPRISDAIWCKCNTQPNAHRQVIQVASQWQGRLAASGRSVLCLGRRGHGQDTQHHG